MNQRTEIESEASASWSELTESFTPGIIASVRAVASDLGLPPLGLTYVRQAARTPSRLVRNTTKSMAGRFASAKMGTIISFESRTLELPFAMTAEQSMDVLAYFCQPPRLKVELKKNGRHRSYQQTPDYLVVKRDGIVLVECKPVDQIVARNQADPGFYVFNETTRSWSCPALQQAARKLGMRHEMCTEESFSPVGLRNRRMLADYYALSEPLAGYAQAMAVIHELLKTEPELTIESVLDKLVADVCVDHIFGAIANGDIAFDLDCAPLAEPSRCKVYRDRQTLDAYRRLSQAEVPDHSRINGAQLVIEEGVTVLWKSASWTCAHVSPKEVTLQGQKKNLVDIPRSEFRKLVDEGQICGVAGTRTRTSVQDAVHQFILMASEEDLRNANLRHAQILPYLKPDACKAKSRTLRRYIACYRHSEQAHGNGYVGLLPRFSRCGNRKPRLEPEVLEVVMAVINEHYRNARNISKKAAYALVADQCSEKALPTPSYAWFCRFIDRLPAYDVELDRKGRKGAYPLEPRQAAPEGTDEAKPERPFERAHIDHTLLDVQTVFGETSDPLGRVWLTLLVDEASRMPLAFHLSYEPPSYRSILATLRKCVQRHGRLPDTLVCDGGKEMRSTWFETACAIYRINVIHRPTSKGRFGSVVERLFGTVNTNFVHYLTGNTQLSKNVRQMSAEVDPVGLAVWTLPDLNRAFERYLYEIYPSLEHRELLVTPQFKFDRGLEAYGARGERHVSYNELFVITTSPSTSKGTARVGREGVKIYYLWYYHPALVRHFGKDVKVRYDPFDMSVAWAFVGGHWLKLRSRHQGVLDGVTEHEIKLTVTEWRQRRKTVENARLTESTLVRFMKEIGETEALLMERRRAAEERCAREQTEVDLEDDDTLVDPFEANGDVVHPDTQSHRNAGDDDDATEPSLQAKKRPRAPAGSSAFATLKSNPEILETC